MIKLFSLKQQKKEGEPVQRPGQRRPTAAQIRITKGMKKFHVATVY